MLLNSHFFDKIIFGGIMESYDAILNILSKNNFTTEERKKIIGFFKNNINNNDIVNKIVHLKNQYMYLKIIHMIEYDVDVSEIEAKRRKYLKNMINSIDKHNVSTKELIEWIIYYFIGDNYYNFLVNFNQLLLYMYHIKKMIISKEHVDFYKECLNINKLKRDDMISFFNKYQDKLNIWEMFYDDMRLVKNHSYCDLVSSSLKLDDSLYSKKISDVVGVKVYHLDGENFYAFIRCIIPGKDGFSKDKLYCNLDKKYYSFSYIGDKNIGTIDRVNDNSITVMYNEINPYNIVHVHHCDSSSGYFSSKDIFVSDKINEICSARSLISNTKHYNEIVIKKSDNGIIPCAIVCFDKICDKDLIVSLKYHLPIVLINRSKYFLNDGYPDYNNDDTYYL